MKKSLKIITIIFTIFCIIALINNTFAMDLETYKPTELTIKGDSPYYTIGGTVISIIRTIAAIVCVITLIIAGITMIYGSIEQKAEYKKKLLPIVIGAFFVVGTTSIIDIISYNVNYESRKYQEEEEQTFDYFDTFTIDMERIFDETYIQGLKESAQKYIEENDINHYKTIQNYISYLEKVQNYRNGYIYTNAQLSTSGTPVTQSIQNLTSMLESLHNNLKIENLESLENLNNKLEYEDLINQEKDYFDDKSIYIMNLNELENLKKLMDEYNRIVMDVGAYSEFKGKMNLKEFSELKSLVEQGIELKNNAADGKENEIYNKEFSYFLECPVGELSDYYTFLYEEAPTEYYGYEISNEYYKIEYTKYLRNTVYGRMKK